MAANETGELFEFDERPVIKGYPELRWTGKRPYRSTQYYPAQLKETFGELRDGWMNKIFWGDNLQVMSHMLKEYRGKIDLIYIDPPFDSKADYKKKIKLRGKQVSGDSLAFEEKQYGDIWSSDEYLQFMYERMILCRELLNESGVFVLHCDWHQSSYLRAIADEIFGRNSFLNEIIWYYYNKMQGNVNRFASNHDNILVYAKGSGYTFNKITEPREKPIKQIKRVWNPETQSLVNAKDAEGHVIYIESTEKAIDDVWRLSMLQPADKKEPVGYPTQKPETLVSRIVSAFSNQGDLVFDCFMGSGTTQAVAMKLGRRFIGADINLGSIQTTTKRLLTVASELGQQIDANDKYLGFEVYNVNNYDFFRNPVEAKELLIQALDIQPFTTENAFDGELDGRMVKVLPTNRIATRADLEGLVANLPYALYDQRKEENPSKPVDHITLVCMGHEPDLKAAFEQELGEYVVDIEIVDILRDKRELEFKREAEADVAVENGKLVIRAFYPMNLLQKLSLQKESVDDWRELVESVLVDWNYDGAVLEPAVTDVPEKNEVVAGIYDVPADAGRIMVKITDVLSESLEVEVG
ncbi:site-specific DNA-methyltransferase [Collinsella intestinalis]|uniref:site-specific DNA-methyltransferase n=1 Tax=Collinsella intestinalis TaxID=147207 RepID=UPI00195EA6F2|nr:site-specific DNA-methyltransferase [Collinsella intestinalis]MBM6682337.1 site-specific DNA-methyltransferase [Collinsella intestinalis]